MPPVALVVVRSPHFDKSIMVCIHHCRITQSSFAALWVLCALPVHHPSTFYRKHRCFEGIGGVWLSWDWRGELTRGRFGLEEGEAHPLRRDLERLLHIGC